MSTDDLNNDHVIPAAWADAEELDGLAFIDKAELVGVPFRITGVYFEKVPSKVANVPDRLKVNVEAEYPDGREFAFNDSSKASGSGPDPVCPQLVAIVTAKGRGDAVESPGEIVPLNLVFKNGLRVSKYKVNGKDEVTGKPIEKEGASYYLTTSGKRPAQAKAAKK